MRNGVDEEQCLLGNGEDESSTGLGMVWMGSDMQGMVLIRSNDTQA